MTMFPNKDKVTRLSSDDDLFPSGMKKSESDVVDDMFLAIQNIVAGTAVVSNKRLSETCYQYKINLFDDFPEITIQYEMKSKNKESVYLIPVVEYQEISKNSGLYMNSSSEHNIYEDTSKVVNHSSFPSNTVRQETPELLSVLNNIEHVKDEELVSIDCPQEKQPTITWTEMNNCNKSTSDSINKYGIPEKILLSLNNLNKTSSVTKERNGNFDCTTPIKRYDKIVKKNVMKKDGEIIDRKEKKYSCSYCGLFFQWMCTMQLHQRIHTGEKPFKCEDCGKCFTWISALKSHKRNHTGDKPFKCEECGKSFSQISNLKTHEKIHSGAKAFTCEECGKSFIQLGNLRKHRTVHTGEKLFICEECGKGFIDSRHLTDHKRVHTGEKPFKCEECGKCFTWISSLKTHVNIHTGKRPFMCEICSKSFTRSHALIEHKKIHTGEKPFQCQECGKYFSQISNLRTHEKIHTGVKPFKCEKCGKSFTQLGHLTKHRKIHLGEKLFTSEACNK